MPLGRTFVDGKAEIAFHIVQRHKVFRPGFAAGDFLVQHELANIVGSNSTAGVALAKFIGCALNGTNTVQKNCPFSRFTDAKAVSEVLAYWVIKELCKRILKIRLLYLHYSVSLRYSQ